MVYPNLKQSVWLLVLFYLYNIALAIPVAIVGAIIDQPLHTNSYTIGFLSLVSCALVLRYVLRRTEGTWSDIVPLKGVSWHLLFPLVLSIVGLLIVISELGNVVMYVIPMPDMLQNVFQELLGKKTSYISAFFIAVVQAPLTEEVFFRGIILTGLLAHCSQSKAIVWSAFLFAAFHMNPWQFPTAFLLGLAFAWWVIQTGSLLPAIVGHALNNFFAVTFARLELPGFSTDLSVVTFQPWWLDICGVILAAVGLWWFYHMANEEETQEIAIEAQPEQVGA
ncbi:MAG: membrane protease YdiL (CAAX protease family) [Candidatus Latescibacterota bacterium]|jgi:membrane protease YdiL (CAAX protease family)